jgi:excisionase family DNA binding protein
MTGTIQVDDFFTPDKLARYLNLSIRTVRKMLLEGEIPSHTLEGARRIAVEDVDAYVAANRWTAGFAVDFESFAMQQLDDGGYVAGEEVEPF